MPASTFQQQLAAYGPAVEPAVPTQAEAEAYCRRLAQTHYENFSVASWFVPRNLRQHFYNLYAYCRWADDLADEAASADESLRLLAWWEDELTRCYGGEASHPVFVALRRTIDEYAIPRDCLSDLLIAFRQDQTQTRYETFDDLLGYCRYSANPVGRLVLLLGRCASPSNLDLSDAICTGLQLANHWQDVARDWQRGRVYLPQEDLRAFGVDEALLAAMRAAPDVRRLIEFEVDRAEEILQRGAPLCDAVGPKLRRQVRLFVGGGLAILEAIRRADYDVLARRPTVSTWKKLRLLASAWMARGAVHG